MTKKQNKLHIWKKSCNFAANLGSFDCNARKATAIDAVTDNPSSVTEKIFRNGQLIILRDGIFYNAQGAVVE